MAKITTMFWDIGGVILTNGWELESRRAAASRFGLNWEEFEDRHGLVVDDFETGRITLAEYLDRTIFYRQREFTAEEVKLFMFEQSQANVETLSILAKLSNSGDYFLAALNNEALELNLYRIENFGLRNYFADFFSSCFLGVRKPNRAIYDIALQVTQRRPEECLYIDDRLLNLECVKHLGMATIHYQNPQQLAAEMHEYVAFE